MSLGDTLEARGLLHASQLCYLLGGAQLEPFHRTDAKLCLIGVCSG